MAYFRELWVLLRIQHLCIIMQLSIGRRNGSQNDNHSGQSKKTVKMLFFRRYLKRGERKQKSNPDSQTDSIVSGPDKRATKITALQVNAMARHGRRRPPPGSSSAQTTREPQNAVCSSPGIINDWTCLVIHTSR